jgi:hypothetical protein
LKRAAVIALVAALALSGCGRLAQREPSAPASSPAPVASVAAPPDLGGIQAQLDAVDAAVDESSADLAEGDAAAGDE